MKLAVLELPQGESPRSVKERSGARRQIRGSSMLFAGRLVAMVINFSVHILIVRYLSRADYGAFAYAMSVVNLGTTVADFGLHRAISRLVPIYHEQHEYQKLAGTVTLALLTILAVGISVALFVYCFQGFIGRALISDAQAVYLLLILTFLSPLDALDRMLVNLFAIFAKPRAIFWRRYVLGPSLKVVVVLLLMGGQWGVSFLAAGYLAASAMGVAIYSSVLYRMLGQLDLLVHFRGPLEIPWNEILTFTLPLLSTDLLHLFTNGMDVVILGHFAGTESVAALRAVRPTAVLNEIVFTSFAMLFTPQAARLFVRQDAAGINDLYWRTATWIAVLTFPVFLLTFSLAQPVTELLFGVRYQGAGVLLGLLSLGYFVQAAFGFNGTTLTIYRHVRYVAVMNVVVAVMSLSLNLFLIPLYGACGAALATCGTLILHNFGKQLGLFCLTDVRLFDWRYLRIYLMIAVGAGGMLIVSWLVPDVILLHVALAFVLSLAMVRANRDLLDLDDTFPEVLTRLPWLRLLLGRAR